MDDNDIQIRYLRALAETVQEEVATKLTDVLRRQAALGSESASEALRRLGGEVRPENVGATVVWKVFSEMQKNPAKCAALEADFMRAMGAASAEREPQP